MKVVVDTNILISAVFWIGKSHLLVDLIEDGNIKLYLSKEIIDEFKEILLRDKFQLRLRDMKSNVEDTLQKILGISEIVEPSRKFDVVEDKSDNKFLDCAYEAKADFIISGDRHLLDLKEFQGIKIVTVNEFLETYEKQS